MQKFIDSAVLLAVSTALLFSWGTANYHGFLIATKLDSDMMERNFHQVIYEGLILAFSPVLLSLILISIVLFFYAHIIFPTYIDLSLIHI